MLVKGEKGEKIFVASGNGGTEIEIRDMCKM